MSKLLSLILLLLALTLIPGFISCTEEICNLPDRNKTSDLLARVARENKYNYCDLLSAALDGNKDSIRKLALLHFSDAAGYDHGAVLVEVILEVNEKRFIDAIRDIPKNERGIIKGYLCVGLAYGYRKEYETKDLKVIFPALYAFLNGN